MGEAISEVLPFAVGVAVVPVPIVAVILMLFSQRARTNAPAFLLGWVGGLTGAFAVLYALADAADDGGDSAPSDGVSWGKVLLGVALLLLAARAWRKRPAAGDAAEMPSWTARLDAIGPWKALGLGVLLAAANPKNLILVAGGAAGLAGLGPSTADAVVGLIVFVAIGSLSVAGPVAYWFLGGAKAAESLGELERWLTANNAAVMTVLLLVLGAVLVSQGLGPPSAR